MDLQGEQLVQAGSLRAPVVRCWGLGKCVCMGGEKGGGGRRGELWVARASSSVAEEGLGEELRRQAHVTPTFCPSPFSTPTSCVSEAPRFESIMEDVEVGAGETARFAVVVEGKPLPDIMWYKVRG